MLADSWPLARSMRCSRPPLPSVTKRVAPSGVRARYSGAPRPPVTTLVALVSLYLIGGTALKGFAFAMIWGVLIGTFSSIFVAAPILLFTNVQRESNES